MEIKYDKIKDKFSNTPDDQFQDKWTLIRLMQTNMSTLNDAKMISKTPNKHIWQIINGRNYYNL